MGASAAKTVQMNNTRRRLLADNTTWREGGQVCPAPLQVMISGMTLGFRKAALPEEAAELWKLDVEIFGVDSFAPEDWLSLESYWILVDGSVAGCAAFIHDVEFGEDLLGDGKNVAQRGTLYIQSTGLRKEFRGRGVGSGVKAWQIDYARRNGFGRIVTNCRESNAAMIDINRKFGFRIIRTTPGYYGDGEATVVMELLLEQDGTDRNP